MPSTLDQLDSQLLDEMPRPLRLRPGTSTNVGLPGGWLLRHYTRRNGRSVFEIFDAGHDLTGLIASTGHPRRSVDAAWRGHWTAAGVGRLWWALAMGHASGDARPSVTFTSRVPHGHVRRTTVTPTVVDGLWIAVVFGRHCAVTMRHGAFQQVMSISPTWGGRA
ncbi:MAG: hypothetical protein QOG22_3529 [Pseudonocardiales bacterium]|jgi:hypothetical protein|nr:hypothetical protein [Pseudonocardiales bacterium]